VRKICEYDEKIEEYSKKKSDLEKQRNQINTKIKNISQSLASAEKELKTYQKKKLLKINQVLVTLPVSYSQIEYTVKMGSKSRLQEDFGSAILFTRSSYNRLGDRIF
jgi:chromosome segregation ATPase